MRHVSILISGYVQGVFFRASAKAKADELGIVGFVRNQTDGSVYIEAEGEDLDLQNFERWCKQGPPRSQVDQIEIKEGELKRFSDFVVQR